MPQPGGQEDHQQVQAGAGQRTAAAAQRKVEVAAEPGPQRDVPAAPEFPHRAGKEGIVEVFGHGQAEHFAQAHRHVAVAGKVVVQLHRIGRIPQQQRRGGQAGGVGAGHSAVEQGQLVGDQRLFGQTQHEPLDAVGEAVGVHPALRRGRVQRRRLVAVAQDGPRADMGEESQIEVEPQRVALGGNLPPGHVHAVADALEGVKAEPQRQGQFQHRQRPGQQGVEVGGKKAFVLEKGQQCQVQHHRQRQQPTGAGRAGQRQAESPVDQREGRQQQRIPHPRPEAEEQTEGRQHPIACPGR